MNLDIRETELTEGRLRKLLAIMASLRNPVDGCPWDLAQTFASIVPFTIEEAYEVADAIEREDFDALRDELGDLLLQVVFHARMAEEAGRFCFADVVTAICEKLLRRHPHVFGDERVVDAAAQSRAWEEHKRREREGSQDKSALAGISRSLPEWQRALKLQSRAAMVGFDWPNYEPVVAKLYEEIEEVKTEFAAVALSPEDSTARDRLADEMGDVLFVVANLARHAKVDVGVALRRANTKFERRFRQMEVLAAADGHELSSLDLATQDSYWNRAKSGEE